MQKDLMAVKKEEEKQESLPVRPRIMKGKGKEPVRQTTREEVTREEVLNALADQIMEDETVEGHESLFGTSGALTVTKRPSHTNL